MNIGEGGALKLCASMALHGEVLSWLHVVTRMHCPIFLSFSFSMSGQALKTGGLEQWIQGGEAINGQITPISDTPDAGSQANAFR